MRKLINLDLGSIDLALAGKGINAKPKALHKIGVSRRRKQTETALKEINDSLTPGDDYKEFVNELEDLKKSYADVDPKGKMIEQEVPINNGTKVKVPVIKENLDKYMSAVEKLRKKYSVVIKHVKDTEDSYEALLLQPLDVKYAKVLFTDFVQEKTSFVELFGLYPLIEKFDDDKLLSSKKEISFTVADIIGKDSDSGLADVNNMSIFNDVVLWDLNIILVFNLRAIREKGLKLKENKKYSDFINLHEKARIELCEVHSKKNVNGDAMKGPQGYILDDINKFNDEFDILKEKNKSIIAAYDKYLESKIKISLVIVSADVLSQVDKALEEEKLILTNNQADILNYFV